MKNTRLTNIILILLLIFNVAFLGNWWYGHWKMHRMNRHGAYSYQTPGTEFLCKKLHFSSSQQEQFEALRNDHIHTMMALESSLSGYEKNLMGAIAQYPSDSARVALYSDSLGRARSMMMREMVRHMSKVRTICDTAQRRKFDEIMNQWTGRLTCPHDFKHGGSEQEGSK